MTLIGIDVGTSAIKAAAYDESGRLLAIAHEGLTPQHPHPGWWEQDPGEVWEATLYCLRSVLQEDMVGRTSRIFMAISASGRECFPVDAAGNPLGPCLIGADVRGAEYEVPPPGAGKPEPWTLSCGHLRERMDPILRLMWWRKNHPEVMAKAAYYLGWHDFLTLKLSGLAVTDPACASRYLVYDLESKGWSGERMAEYEIKPGFLAEVGKWGEIIGDILPQVGSEIGLPRGSQLAVGCHDSQSAGLGVGVTRLGSAALACGSFENMMILVRIMPAPELLLHGLSFMPYPDKTGMSVISVSPTGNAVLNWARQLLGVPLDVLEDQLVDSGPSPSPVTAVPYLSGSMLYWEDGRLAKGALVGLTLATSQLDVIKSFMESVAYEHINTLNLLRDAGVFVKTIRAAGGGSRSAWWTQLKCDILGVPIEVVDQEEPGTLGAALLAGLAAGYYSDLNEQSQTFSTVCRSHEPNAARAALYQERLETNRILIPTLISAIFSRDQ